jgi:hypothetical protein
MPVAGQQLTQRFHANTAARTEVDAAEKCDLRGHRRVLRF